MAAPWLYRPFDPELDQPRLNPDGSVSTEITRTVQTPDGEWVNVPSLWWDEGGGASTDLGQRTDDQLAELAGQYEQRSGEQFPHFGTLEEAEQSAVARSAGGGASQTPLAQAPKSRQDLVAALSMGAAPQQQGTADPRWQRLMQALAFDPAQFGAGGQEMELAQGVTDPNAKFQGGGASGTWAPAAEPPSTLGEWWEQSTAFRPMAEEAYSAATLPGDVYAGRVDPASDEAIERAAGLAGMVTLGAGAIPAKGAELGMGIRAYHGSPHDFDKFSMDKIGTGEGAQVYGHGLYYAENEAVAKQYRDTLGINNKKWLVDGEHVGTYGENSTVLGRAAANVRQARGSDGKVSTEDAEKAIANFLDVHRRNKGMIPQKEIDATVESMRSLVGREVSEDAGGKMYEVDIAADPEHFLDWDKPLSQQSEAVKTLPQIEAIKERMVADASRWGTPSEAQLARYREQADEIVGRMSGEEIHAWIREDFRENAPADVFAQTNLKQVPSDILREAGIPGIRYLDQGSRGARPAYRGDQSYLHAAQSFKDDGSTAEQTLAGMKQAYKNADQKTLQAAVDEAFDIQPPQTSNYVVFDDALINILRKYGMAGMIGTPLGLEMAQRLMEQEQGQQEGGNTL
jgi:hypothetical protein